MATFKDTSGNDTLIGTSDADTFVVAKGGEDAVSGLAATTSSRYTARSTPATALTAAMAATSSGCGAIIPPA